MGFECCYKCEDRHIGCHSECDKYKLAKEESEYERNQAIKEKKDMGILLRHKRPFRKVYMKRK